MRPEELNSQYTYCVFGSSGRIFYCYKIGYIKPLRLYACKMFVIYQGLQISNLCVILVILITKLSYMI